MCAEEEGKNHTFELEWQIGKLCTYVDYSVPSSLVRQHGLEAVERRLATSTMACVHIDLVFFLLRPTQTFSSLLEIHARYTYWDTNSGQRASQKTMEGWVLLSDEVAIGNKGVGEGF